MKKRIKILLLLILFFAISVICKNSKTYATISTTTPDTFVANNEEYWQVVLPDADRYGIFCNQKSVIFHWDMVYLSPSGKLILQTNGCNSQFQNSFKWKAESSGSSLPNMAGYAFYLADQLGVLESAYKNGSFGDTGSVYRALQDILWASCSAPANEHSLAMDGIAFDGVGNGGSGAAGTIRTATRKYAQVYYRILKYINDENVNNKNRGSIFKTTAADSDGVKVYVDQTTGKYTVGPYITQINPYISSLGINTGSATEYNYAVRALYDVIVNPSNTAALNFATFNGLENFNALTNAEGKYLDANGNPTIEFIDENGNRIKFPNFAEKKKYYIRFTPANDGAICDLTTLHNGDNLIDPGFKMTYFSSFSGYWTKYKCIQQNFNVTGIKGIPTTYNEMIKFLDDNGFQYSISDGTKTRSYQSVDHSHKSDAPTTPFTDTVTVTIPANLAWGGEAAHPIMDDKATITITYTFSHEAVCTGLTEKEERHKHWYPVYNYEEVTDPKTGKVTKKRVPPYEDYNWVHDYYKGDFLYKNLSTLSKSDPGKISYVGSSVSGGSISRTDTQDPLVTSKTQHHIIIKISGGNGGNISMQTATTTEYIPNATINMELQGTVWVDQKGATKESKYNGQMDDSEAKFPGIQVLLYEYGYSNGKYATERTQGDKLIATTTTDSNGKYWFFGRKPGTKEPLMNPLRQYYVVFTYNGQLYQDTYYMNDLSTDGKHSNAQEVNASKDKQASSELSREDLNAKFASIHSYDKSYDNNKAFAYSSSVGLNFSTYWEDFIKRNTFKGSAVTEPSANDYYVEYNRQQSYNYTGTNSEADQYIKDCMLTSYTGSKTERTARYPSYDKYVIYNIDKNASTYKATGNSAVYTIGNNRFNFLYTYNWDQARNVNLGLFVRQQSDLALQKDIYKATLLVNGQKQVYNYNKKDARIDEDGDNIWTVNLRSSDALYNDAAKSNDASKNGPIYYDREVYASDYLYDDSLENPENTQKEKNLQVFVTYRIAVKNLGTVDTKVDEIVDYYDSTVYELDTKYITPYIGNRNNEKLQDATVSENPQGGAARKTIVTESCNYQPLYISGIKGQTNKDDWLRPGEMAFVYLTFKVKNDPNTNRPYLDEELTTPISYKVGKRNIAEINAYSTRYTDNTALPNYIASNGSLQDEIVGHDNKAGIVDFNSNAGNLTRDDLIIGGTRDGRINYKVENNYKYFDPGTLQEVPEDKESNTLKSVKYKHVENDTDQAPNFRLIIDNSENTIREFKGHAYEDSRSEAKDDLKVMIGDGTDKDETKVNGVTIRLIELSPVVDSNGAATGEYHKNLKEVEQHIAKIENGKLKVVISNNEYYSGTSSSKQFYTGDSGTIFAIGSTSLDAGQGQYSLRSIPAGNYYIEFKYGDTDRTVLTNNTTDGGNTAVGYQEDGKVNKLLNKTGLNAKSYNGQDYKSTIYQAGVNQNDITAYRGIKGYTDPNNQEYTSKDYENNYDKSALPSLDISKMCLYDINAAGAVTGISDAKDSYYRREANIEYSKELKNHRAEVLDSFEKLGQVSDGEDKANYQRKLIDELEAETYMEAKTGVINTEVEYTRTESDTYLHQNDKKENVYSGNGENGSSDYKVKDIDLGLQERPRSQLMLNKQVTGVKVILPNGQTLFDTAQSANNLTFTQHKYHTYWTANKSNSEGNDIHANNNFVNTTDLRLFNAVVSANNVKN